MVHTHTNGGFGMQMSFISRILLSIVILLWYINWIQATKQQTGVLVTHCKNGDIYIYIYVIYQFAQVNWSSNTKGITVCKCQYAFLQTLKCGTGNNSTKSQLLDCICSWQNDKINGSQKIFLRDGSFETKEKVSRPFDMKLRIYGCKVPWSFLLDYQLKTISIWDLTCHLLPREPQAQLFCRQHFTLEHPFIFAGRGSSA
jgi:hypothetical protein